MNTYTQETTPYFYIIRHIETGRLYAGSRWAKGCNPNELLKEDGYLTSSKIVRNLLKDDIACFEVVTIKTDCEDVKAYETSFIEDNNCVRSELWLNGHDNKRVLSHDSNEFKSIMKKLYGEDHWAKTREGRDFHRKQMIAFNQTEEAKDRLLARNTYDNPAKKQNNREKHSKMMKELNEKMLKDGTHPTLNPKNLEEASKRMKITMATQPELTCPHCNRSSKNKSNMLRWHFDKCKFKK